MQLLNVHTLRLTTFYDQDVPRYAILSHTWEDEEILYGDICDPEKPFPQHKKGFFKVKHSCEQAACDEFDWIWIDTCCIDKSSSAELSEAINSMFRWYNDSAVCYAYISDVVKTDAQSVRFVDSRWFTRGWTLQELIAPKRVVFFDARWERIGWRQHESLANEIAEATGIPSDLLERRNTQLPGTDLRAKLDRYSVAQRFSWASKRSTKRVEDEAYCLLGIFGVNMPLLYGEGPKAFFRFQQEILRTTDDQSILAFQHTSNSNNLLAESPRDYTVSGGIGRPSFLNENDPGSSANSILTPSAKVLKMRLYLCPPLRPDLKSQYLGVLSCVLHLHGDTNQTVFPVMDLEPVRHSTKPNEFYRTANHHLSIVTPGSRHIMRRSPGSLWSTDNGTTSDFDLAKAQLTNVRIYFHHSEPYKPESKPWAITHLGIAMNYSRIIPGVRLNVERVLRYHRARAYPHDLEPIPNTGDRQYYGKPTWCVTSYPKRFDLAKTEHISPPHGPIAFDTYGAMISRLNTRNPDDWDSSPDDRSYDWDSWCIVLWGATWKPDNASKSSYLCLLLDISKIITVAKRKRLTDFTALMDLRRNYYLGWLEDASREYLGFLCDDSFTPKELGEAVIGTASLEHPVVYRRSWGEFVFKVLGEHFMGQPCLDVAFTVNAYDEDVDSKLDEPDIPQDLKLHEDIHELEGSFPDWWHSTNGTWKRRLQWMKWNMISSNVKHTEAEPSWKYRDMT